MSEHDEDPTRDRDTTGLGYPEEQQGGGMDARDHSEDDVTPDDDDAPRTSTERDGDPDQATGNPKAAGG